MGEMTTSGTFGLSCPQCGSIMQTPNTACKCGWYVNSGDPEKFSIDWVDLEKKQICKEARIQALREVKAMIEGIEQGISDGTYYSKIYRIKAKLDEMIKKG